MINPEGSPISEEEIMGEDAEKTKDSIETPLEYANELRAKIGEASAEISDLERQRKLKAELIAQEKDVDELKKMIREYNELDEQLAQTKEVLSDSSIALETTAELGILLPESEEEFNVNVSDFDSQISESLEVIAEVTAMNDLLTQRDNLRSQLQEAGASKDEVRFTELTDSYIMLNKEIAALVRKEINVAKKVQTLTEIKKMAA